jgi:hypothetical protein
MNDTLGETNENQSQTSEQTKAPTSFREALSVEYGKSKSEETPTNTESQAPATVETKAPVNGSQTATAQQQQTQQPAAQQRKAVPILPPAQMSAEERADFEKLSPEAQSFVSRFAYQTRTSISRAQQELQNRSKRYDSIDNVLTPHQQWLDKKGLQAGDVVRRSIAWEQAFEQDRLGAAIEYLRAQGVDPLELIDQNAQGGEGGQPSAQARQQPSQQFTPQQIQQLVDQQIEQRMQMQSDFQTVQHHTSVVDEFIKGKSLFEDPNTAAVLEAEMAPLVALARSQGKTELEALNYAYSVTTTVNPAFASLLQGFERGQAANKARADAEKLKNSTRSIAPSGLANGRSSEGLSFREELGLRRSGAM